MLCIKRCIYAHNTLFHEFNIKNVTIYLSSTLHKKKDMKKEKIHISKAIIVLHIHYLEIITVYEWADWMGYSRSHFTRIFIKEFRLCPKDKIKEYRLTLIKKRIRKNPMASCQEIALEVGLGNSKSLRKFLYTHYNLNLTALKKCCTVVYK